MNETATSGGDLAPSIFDRRLQRLSVEFTVHRISAPRGAFSGSEQVWNLVSGRLASAEASLHLAENGFRAAIGLESHREPLLEMLKSIPDLRSAVDHAAPDSAQMVELELGPCAAHTAIFYIDSKGHLRGLDFMNARARLKLTFEMRSPRFNELWLRVIPELEEPAGPMKWHMTPAGPAQSAEERRHSFDTLSCEAQIPAGGFLLLGPSPSVYDRPLAARPFFTERSGAAEEAVVERESIFVISPIVRVVGEGTGDGSAGGLREGQTGASRIRSSD